ncbi:NADH-ubiquinone oxidoreductase-F iron-sulfur binding region domain-containing protein [Nocardia shimofusensis]|uniref:NADH-ubiquinone oxidoreductase-F iron-sulfur binding region domain-containing protein n=1 Tax=Nocardia shimofusensis TaxID=228596 RepID=UPI000832F9C9|nr:NADH-ubiquinone oxidoreductase-F iron-sulfur binding region domain-containing protein [Nocardia shimofusensis]
MHHDSDPPRALTVAVAPGVAPRLLRDIDDVEDLARYRAEGGYRVVGATAELLDQISTSGLRGRGGAGFPLAVKLSGVRAAALRGSRTVAVANGEEGEPASIKDKWLMRHRPHLVLDGLRLAAAVVGAHRAVVYLSDGESARAVDHALTELDAAAITEVPIELVVVEPGYVAGEETAAVRAVNGGPAKPTDKPPRPFESGVDGLPTLINNVETLAHLPFIQAHGGEAFRAVGTPGSPGTFLATVTGGGRGPGLYELAHGTPFATLLDLHGVPASEVRGALMGGYFSGLLGEPILDATLDHESLRALGSALGCGAVALLTDECPVTIAAAVLAYFDRENAGQCGSCFNGTAAMAAAATALHEHRATDTDLANLHRWSTVLRGRGACATLDAAANIAESLLTAFPAEVRAHLTGRCPTCADPAPLPLRPFHAETAVLA